MRRLAFYLLNLTWGIPLNLAGGAVAVVLLAAGHRPSRFGGCLIFECGRRGWGGLNLGLVVLCQPDAPDDLKAHEVGHAVQNCLWGALTPLVVHLPSGIRFHVRNKKAARGEVLPPYDAVWYEAQATRWGEWFVKNIIDVSIKPYNGKEPKTWK